MRSYCYRDVGGSTAIFGGRFEFEVRGDCAVVLLCDHLIPLAVSEIPTRLYRRFLWPLDPRDISFVEFDLETDSFRLVDFRWTETAGAYRYLGAVPLSVLAVTSLGLAAPRWRRALAAAAVKPCSRRREAGTPV
jgi:hypothetical protein